VDAELGGRVTAPDEGELPGVVALLRAHQVGDRVLAPARATGGGADDQHEHAGGAVLLGHRRQGRAEVGDQHAEVVAQGRGAGRAQRRDADVRGGAQRRQRRAAGDDGGEHVTLLVGQQRGQARAQCFAHRAGGTGTVSEDDDGGAPGLGHRHRIPYASCRRTTTPGNCIGPGRG